MSNCAKIYVVEDDDSIRLLLQMALKSAGYEVKAFSSAQEGIMAMREEKPDALLLDIMLDGMSGIDAIRVIRSDENISALPVMMLTALGSESDKVVGLDAGADDYMTKPFGVPELCARVRALLRRGQKQEACNILKSDGLQLDLDTREVILNGNLLELTYKETELLKKLMETAPKALSREELLQGVWGYDYLGETRTLDMHIGTLRAKLCDDAGSPKYIKTVRGVGYRFASEVFL